MKTILMLCLLAITGICTQAQTPKVTTAGEVQKLMRNTPKPTRVEMGTDATSIWGRANLVPTWLFVWHDNDNLIMRMRTNSDTLEINNVERIKYIKVGDKVYSLNVSLTEVTPTIYGSGLYYRWPGTMLMNGTGAVTSTAPALDTSVHK